MNNATAAPDWERVRAVFAAVLDVPRDQRRVWLETQCTGEPALLHAVERLLAAHEDSRHLLDGDGARFVVGLIGDESATADPRVGTSFGAYRLLAPLGAGGMGSVYLAERTDGQFQQQVALKLIHDEVPTREMRERFLREREILARLNHPNIAALHDGGITDHGTPYFTLEYVEGEPITRWCDERRLGIAERVRLLLKVCEAVQYAHRNLVVHRDLKPSNLLVTRAGEPKLLDFGIAKWLDDGATMPQLTGTRSQPMTREYAAPEQVLAQPITTATDVYALGVLLYELLCGRLPYRQGESGAISWPKAIVEEIPEPLSRAITRRRETVETDTLAQCRNLSTAALRRTLHGDLDRIVRHALEKQPEARYASIEAFADDLRAWLQHRPIRGSGWRYRARMFVRRHWLPLGAAAAVALALAAGVIGMVWQAREVAREARTTAEVKDFLIGLFSAVDPRESKGQDIRARDLLDRGAQKIEHDLADQPALQAELQSVLGRIYHQLGLYRQASALLERAIATLDRERTNLLLAARTRSDRAASLDELGDLDAASSLGSDAIARLQALPEASAADRVQALLVQSHVEINRRRFDSAKRIADEAVAQVRATRLAAPLLAQALLIAGGADWGLPALDDAEAKYREALSLLLPAAGDDDMQVAKTRANLAMVLRGKSRYAEALALAQQAYATQRKVLGDDHPVTLHGLRDIGLTHYHLGQYRQARETLEKVAAAQRLNPGPDHPDRAGTLINLGLALTDDGQLEAAEQAFSEALHIWEKRYGHDYPGVTTALGDLGYVHLLEHRFDEAESELQESMALDRKRGSENSFGTLRLGELQRLGGDAQAAIRLDRAALDLTRQNYGENSRQTAAAHHYLGLALRDSGDATGAEAELRAALAAFAGYIPQARHPLAASVRIDLASLLAPQPSALTERQRLLDEATAIRETFLGADDPRTRDARAQLTGLRTTR